MIPLEEAQDRILSLIPPPRVEDVPLSLARGRIAGRAITSPIALPGFDMSAMDGYAARVQDLEKASPDHPVALVQTSKIPAGTPSDSPISAGECCRVFTGSPLPAGADCVVMQEDVTVESPGRIMFREKPQPWENVRFRGEDVASDTQVLQAGEALHPGTVALLGALGVRTVSVGAAPVVEILASGNEIREAGATLAPGQIYESNRLTLHWLCQGIGAVSRIGRTIPDDPLQTRIALREAFDRADVVVTSGGVSVGEFDFLKEAFTEIGGELTFWRVAIKPGKPFVCGRLGQKWFFGLPGNPVSAFVTFLLLVRPALLKWQGAARVGLETRIGTLVEPLQNRGDRRHFVRVILEQGLIRSAGQQGSHRLLSLAAANALVDVPPEADWEAGRQVSALQWS